MPADHDPIDALLQRFAQGDRRALARLITAVDNGQQVDAILGEAQKLGRKSLKVGITGAAGAGKSTTVAALLKFLREIGKTVAVLACDPASPFTGGALLGDRVRMDYDPADKGVYLRSLSTRGAAGGLSDSAEPIILLVEQFGFDVILVETVGAGQDQLAVQSMVDLLALLLTPVAGDIIQWEKAGLMEAADVIAINKADLPGADVAFAGVRAILEIATGERSVPLLKLSAQAGQGIRELWEAVEQTATDRTHHRQLAAGRRLLDLARRKLAERYRARADDRALLDLVESFAAGQVPSEAAASRLLALLQ